MSHTIKFGFGEQGTSETWNNATYEILPTGFYTACTLTKVSDIEVQISTFTAHIQDSVKDLSVRIENTAVESGIAVDSTNKYVIIRLTWVNSSANDFQVLGVAVGDILATDLLVGECQFSGATLTGFVYTSQSISVLKNNGDEVRNFQNLTEKTTIVNNDTFIINDSADSNNPKNVKQSTVITDVLSDITNQTPKTSFVDADEFIMNDSADGNAPKKITGENIITSVLGDITTQTAKTSLDNGDELIINDNEDSGAVKKIAGSLIAGIEEKSTSGNITAIRYTDGTQIAYGHIDITFSGVTFASSSIGTIPLAFANTSYKIVCSASDDGGGAYALALNASESGSRTTTSFNISMIDVAATSKTGTYRAEWFAIGTWS